MQTHAFLLSLSFATVAATASAADVASDARTAPVRLGEPGSVALGLDASIGAVTGRPYDPGGPGGYGSDLVLSPNVDWFVARSVSLGLDAPLQYRIPTGTRAPSPYFAPAFPTVRAGYLVPLSRRVAFWPALRVGCDADGNGGSFASCSYRGTFVAADTRVAIEIVPHAYVTATPLLAQFAFDRERRPDSFGGLWFRSMIGVGGVF